MSMVIRTSERFYQKQLKAEIGKKPEVRDRNLRVAIVGSNPSVLIISMTCFTLSDCCLALPTRLAEPNSTSMLSVPAEMNVRVVRIRI